jgi:VCBS repeat-containing protein
VLTYRVSVTDDSGVKTPVGDNEIDTVWQDVTITITGSNDAPVVTNSTEELFGQVIEQSTAGPGVDTASGRLTVSDLDVNDSVRWSLVGPAGSKYGDLRVDPLTGVWIFKLDNTRDATVRLSQGQTAQVQYVVRATDQFGAFVDQVVTVSIVGRDNVLPSAIHRSPIGIDEDMIVPTGRLARSGFGDGHLAPFVVPELPTRLQLGASVEFLPQLLEASRIPLRNTLVPPDVMPELGGKVVFQLPEGTFTGGDGVIWLYATLRDGSPLPDWIRFDGVTGQIEADVPDSLTEPLEIRVQARDAHGETAETVFKILPRGEDLGFSGKPSLSAQFQQMMDAHN